MWDILPFFEVAPIALWVSAWGLCPSTLSSSRQLERPFEDNSDPALLLPEAALWPSALRKALGSFLSLQAYLRGALLQVPTLGAALCTLSTSGLLSLHDPTRSWGFPLWPLVFSSFLHLFAPLPPGALWQFPLSPCFPSIVTVTLDSVCLVDDPGPLR